MVSVERVIGGIYGSNLDLLLKNVSCARMVLTRHSLLNYKVHQRGVSFEAWLIRVLNSNIKNKINRQETHSITKDGTFLFVDPTLGPFDCEYFCHSRSDPRQCSYWKRELRPGSGLYLSHL